MLWNEIREHWLRSHARIRGKKNELRRVRHGFSDPMCSAFLDTNVALRRRLHTESNWLGLFARTVWSATAYIPLPLNLRDLAKMVRVSHRLGFLAHCLLLANASLHGVDMDSVDLDHAWRCDWIARATFTCSGSSTYKVGREANSLRFVSRFLFFLSITVLIMISQLKFVVLNLLCLAGASQFPSSPNGLTTIQSKLDRGVTLSFKEVRCKCLTTKPYI